MSTIPGLFEKVVPLPPGVQAVTVLIADPDPAVFDTISTPLQNGGYVVLEACSEAQALKAIYEQQPDIVVLSSSLSDANADRLCHRIKSDAAIGFLPLIVLADTETAADLVHDDPELGPDALLMKPVALAELAMWLQSMVKLKVQVDRKLDRLASEERRLEMLRNEIITNISHELGTPLLQMKSAMSLLVEVNNRCGTPEQLRLSDMATQAVARMEHEVNNIKQLARMHDVRLAPVLLTDVVERVLRLLGRSWKSREAVGRIQVVMQDDLPLVLADKIVLSQLLQVLLDNALKFSAADDEVFLHIEYADDDHVWIGVEDTGIGIPVEEQEHIFDAFYKVDASATRRYGGSGTGLALATLLASGMNITIELDSAPGEGSVFSFVLPVVDPDEYLDLL